MAALCAGCLPSAYERARARDTADAYRALLREAPAGPERDAARARLAQLDFESARSVHTPIAYKRFLEEFPDSDRKPAALALLESLRFEAARQAGTAAAIEDFLRDHADGHHAAESRAALAALDLDAAKKADTVRAIAAFLARHPASPARPELERRLDDLAFADAERQGPRDLAAYLDRHPAGAHRDPARAILLRHRVGWRARAGDIAGAYAEARTAAEPEASALASEIAVVDLEAVEATLDPAALANFARAHPGPLADKAAQRAAAIRRRPNAAVLRKLAARLDPSRFTRPAGELLRALEAPDPRHRWLAARELAVAGSIDAADRLLAVAASSRFLLVRREAFLALATVWTAMPAEARESEVSRRRQSLVEPAAGEPLAKRAMLSEAGGAAEAAVTDYGRLARSDAGDLLAWWRLSELRRARGDALGAAIAARQVAVQVDAALADRLADGAVPLLLARTLCGLHVMVVEARRALDALPESAARDFPEDLTAFRNRAADVDRKAAARLSDAEAAARAVDRDLKRCVDDDVTPRLADGERDRLDAVKALAALREPLALPALRRASLRDPSAAVRRAAAEHLTPQPPSLKGRGGG